MKQEMVRQGTPDIIRNTSAIHCMRSWKLLPRKNKVGQWQEVGAVGPKAWKGTKRTLPKQL